MRILLVEWMDSCSDSGWKKIQDVDNNSMKCISAGICLKKDRKALTLGLSISEAHHYSEEITIPRCSIKRIRQLKVCQPHYRKKRNS